MTHAHCYQRQTCRTCGGYHGPITDGFSSNCLLFSVSTHKTSRGDGYSDNAIFPDDIVSYRIPVGIRKQAAFFDDIWFDFVEIKELNKIVRDRISSFNRDKGALKEQAPLPWLKWESARGHGQTRKQENYDNMWLSQTSACKEDGGKAIGWLTIIKSRLGENAQASRLSNQPNRENVFASNRPSSAGLSSYSSSGSSFGDCSSPLCELSVGAVGQPSGYMNIDDENGPNFVDQQLPCTRETTHERSGIEHSPSTSPEMLFARKKPRTDVTSSDEEYSMAGFSRYPSLFQTRLLG